MPEAGEDGPGSEPKATAPRTSEERAGEASAGRGTTDRQAPAAEHVVSGMEHGPDPHGAPPLFRFAPVTVAAGAATGAAVPLTDEPSETEQA